MKSLKSNLTLVVTVVLLSCQIQAESANTPEEALKNYAKYANANDADNMAKLLHPAFRSISNRLFGSVEASITTKEDYLKLLADKVIGGGERQMTIMAINLEGTTANAKIKMSGKDLSFVMFVFLVQLEDGNWQIISDLPQLIK